MRLQKISSTRCYGNTRNSMGRKISFLMLHRFISKLRKLRLLSLKHFSTMVKNILEGMSYRITIQYPERASEPPSRDFVVAIAMWFLIYL